MQSASAQTNAPRKIGVVGGVGPQAGLDLVGKIVASTRATRDQDHLPVALLSFPGQIPDRTDFLLGHTADNPGRPLADIALALADAGAEIIGVPCNTAHAPAIFDVIRARLAGRAELVDMVEEVGEEIARRFPSAETIGVLSTTGTLVTQIYPRHLGLLGYRVVQLPPDLQERYVQPAIYDPEYGLKSVSDPPNSRAVSDLRTAAAHLAQDGVDLIVLACTEIPLALPEAGLDGVPFLDPTRVLARALVRRSAPASLAEWPP